MLVKIGEPRAQEAHGGSFDSRGQGQGSHQDGQVYHTRLPRGGQACGEERLEQKVVGAVAVRDWRGQVFFHLCPWRRTALSRAG